MIFASKQRRSQLHEWSEKGQGVSVGILQTEVGREKITHFILAGSCHAVPPNREDL